MSVTLISVSHDTVVSNKHEERTRHYYVIFQHPPPLSSIGPPVQFILAFFLSSRPPLDLSLEDPDLKMQSDSNETLLKWLALQVISEDYLEYNKRVEKSIESALEENSKRIRLEMPVNSLALIYYHTVHTCLYWIYQYCL